MCCDVSVLAHSRVGYRRLHWVTELDGSFQPHYYPVSQRPLQSAPSGASVLFAVWRTTLAQGLQPLLPAHYNKNKSTFEGLLPSCFKKRLLLLHQKSDTLYVTLVAHHLCFSYRKQTKKKKKFSSAFSGTTDATILNWKCLLCTIRSHYHVNRVRSDDWQMKVEDLVSKPKAKVPIWKYF